MSAKPLTLPTVDHVYGKGYDLTQVNGRMHAAKSIEEEQRLHVAALRHCAKSHVDEYKARLLALRSQRAELDRWNQAAAPITLGGM
jgi:hypothetical protein